MKSELIRINSTIAAEIKRISNKLGVTTASASVIVLYDLTEGKERGKLNLEEFRMRFWRKKLKGKVAMSL